MKQFIKIQDIYNNTFWLNTNCIESICKYKDPRSNKDAYQIVLTTGTVHNTSFNVLLDLGIYNESVVSRTLP